MAAPAKNINLTRSQEDYLEAILHLVRRRKVARVRDIARRMGVGMPSVTAALRGLSKRKLVHHDPYQFVTLTDRGSRRAEQISRRREQIRRFLTDVLGMDTGAAESSACRLEHAVGPAVLERLKKFAEFVRQSPETGPGWIAAFRAFCGNGRTARPRRRAARARGKDEKT